MPAHVKKVGKKYRVVDPDGKVVKNNAGTAVDGGGHATKARASKQASAINIPKSMRKAKFE